MNRFIVKRPDQFQYSANESLEKWIPLSDVNEANSFATREAAEAAIGRYTMRIARTLTDFDGSTVLSWFDLKVVEIEARVEWTEVE